MTLKRNNETLKKELELYQSNKNNAEKKDLDEKNKKINDMSSCLRLILKDLSRKYETEKNRMHLKGLNDTVKQEMLKLGLDEENVGDFMGKDEDENINKAKEQIDLLLNDNENFSSEKTYKLYNTLFSNLMELENENRNNNNNNGLSFNNYNRSGNTSNNIFSCQSSGINNNYFKGKNNYNYNNMNLLESKI